MRMPTPDVCSGWEIDVVDYEMKFDDSPSFTILRKNGASDNSCSRSSNCTPSTSSIKRSKSLSDVSGMDSLTADVVEVSRSVSRAICKEGACSDKLSEYCGSHSAVIQFSLTSDVKDDGEDDGEVRDCDFSLSSLDEESDADMQSESSDLFGGEQIALVKHLIKLFEEKCESKEEEEMMKLSMQLAGQKEVDSEETQHERTGKEEEEERSKIVVVRERPNTVPPSTSEGSWIFSGRTARQSRFFQVDTEEGEAELSSSSSVSSSSSSSSAESSSCSPSRSQRNARALSEPRPLLPTSIFVGSQLCQICFDRKASMMLPCRHTYCHECLEYTIRAKIEERHSQLICPDVECDYILTNADVRVISKAETYNRWQSNREAEAVAADPDTFYCPTTDCNGVLRKPEGLIGRILLQCCKCGSSICSTCERTGCKGTRCTRAVALELEKNEQLLQDWMKEENAKPCPHCRIPIQKTEGCNHMTCSACKYEFCWLCGDEMELDHYFNLTSKCFDQQFIMESDYTGELWTGALDEEISSSPVVISPRNPPRRRGVLSRLRGVFSR